MCICIVLIHKSCFVTSLFWFARPKRYVHNCVGLDLKGLVDAAENYHGVLAENQKLFNEVQELKGNSCAVYCWSTLCDCN